MPRTWRSTANTVISPRVPTRTNGHPHGEHSWRSWKTPDSSAKSTHAGLGGRRMDQELDAMFGFAPDHDSPVPYMQRTRDYYKAIGYTTPYRWAHYLQAPFTAMTKPLSECNVAIITTAAPYQPSKGD